MNVPAFFQDRWSVYAEIGVIQNKVRDLCMTDEPYLKHLLLIRSHLKEQIQIFCLACCVKK